MIVRMIFAVCFMATTVSAQKNDVDLDRLVQWMRGSYSSASQSAADTSYRDVRLHIVQIWSDRTDGFWLYYEQALATSEDYPYRQFLYRVARIEQGLIECTAYTLRDPIALVGAWKDTSRLEGMSPSDVLVRRGCEVFLQADATSYHGRTMGTACASHLAGASYSTTDLKIYEHRIDSWERGFNTSNSQVWGATKGPYIFLRTATATPGQQKD